MVDSGAPIQHAEHEGSELGGSGNCTGIQKPYQRLSQPIGEVQTHEEATICAHDLRESAPSKKPKKNGGKGFVALLKIPGNQVACSRTLSCRIPLRL